MEYGMDSGSISNFRDNLGSFDIQQHPEKNEIPDEIVPIHTDTIQNSKESNTNLTVEKSSFQNHIERLVGNISLAKNSQEQQQLLVEVLETIVHETKSIDKSIGKKQKQQLSPEKSVEVQIEIFEKLGVSEYLLEQLALCSATLIDPSNTTEKGGRERLLEGVGYASEALATVGIMIKVAVVAKLRMQLREKEQEVERISTKSSTLSNSEIKNLQVLQEEINEIHENISNSTKEIALDTAKTTANSIGEVLSSLAQEVKKATVVGSAFSVVGSIVGLVSSLNSVRQKIVELKKITQEKKELQKDLKNIENKLKKYKNSDLKKYKAYENLYTLVDLKLMYVDKLKLLNATGELIKESVSTVSSGQSTASAICTALSIKGAVVAALGPAGLVLLAGSLSLGATLYLSTDRAMFLNNIKQIPKKLEMRHLDQEMSRIKELEFIFTSDQMISKIQDGNKEVLGTFKEIVSKSAERLNQMGAEMKNLVKQAEKLDAKIKNREPSRDELEQKKVMWKKMLVYDNKMEKSLQEHSKKVDLVMNVLSDPKGSVELFRKNTTKSVDRLQRVKLKIGEDLEIMTKNAMKQKEVDRLGATQEDMQEFRSALTRVLKDPGTEKIIREYLSNKIDMQQFNKDPQESIMEYLFEYTPVTK